MSYTKLVNGVPTPMSAEEIAERQAEEALPVLLPLATRLEDALVGLLTDNIQNLPAGLPTQIFQLKAALKEMALFMPDEVFASEALNAIANFPLPEALEALRPELLAVFNG